MIRYICSICGYAHDGDNPPDFCPQCSAPQSKFQLLGQEGKALPDEHRVGISDGIDPEIVESLRSEYRTQCTDIGIYLAMARQADREGLPQVADTLQRIAMEGADHAGRLAEVLGEMLFADTEKNLELRADAEYGASENKKKIATIAKQLNLDAIHDTVHEMCKDDARHYKMLKGLLEQYF